MPLAWGEVQKAGFLDTTREYKHGFSFTDFRYTQPQELMQLWAVSRKSNRHCTAKGQHLIVSIVSLIIESTQRDVDENGKPLICASVDPFTQEYTDSSRFGRATRFSDQRIASFWFDAQLFYFASGYFLFVWPQVSFVYNIRCIIDKGCLKECF